MRTGPPNLWTYRASSRDGRRATALTTSPRQIAPRGLIHTADSPHSLLREVPIGSVRFGEGFWKPRVEAITGHSVMHQLGKLREEGVFDNFLRVAGKGEAPDRGYVFRDSDLYKWIEGACFALQLEPDEALLAEIDRAIAVIEDAQAPDGYINTYYQTHTDKERFSNLQDHHEIYCLGHLFQAAAAHHRTTGNPRLLAIAQRAADYLVSVFGPDKRAGHCGHPEAELGLVELYRETGNEAYLALARFFVDDNRGTEFTEITGHAVRALYFLCGMADLALETGAEDLRAVCDRLWKSMVETRIYVTGAVGGRHSSEAFGRAFELPQEGAYAETCANIGSAMLQWRMLALTGDATYTDLMELTLYNSVLSGVSLDGTRFFYENPHASSGEPYPDPWYPWQHQPEPTQRKGWYGCACCPPNVARTVTSVGGLFYSTDASGVWVHLYDAGVWEGTLDDGTPIRITQTTDYPWDGRVELRIEPETERHFALRVRVPGWCEGATLRVNDDIASPAPGGLYHTIGRLWAPGDTITLDLPMPPVFYVGNPRAAELRNAVALRRGPLVYCFEAEDNPGTPVLEARVDPASAGFVPSFERDLLGGVVALEGTGYAPEGEWGPLYRPIAPDTRPLRTVPLRAVPYYAWCNRTPGAMAVWLQRV